MIADPIANMKTVTGTFASTKIAYTNRLAALATKLNAGRPVTAADITDLIQNYYDPLTAASNDLRSANSDMLAMIGQPTDTQIYDTWFGIALNSILSCSTKDQALDVVNKMAADFTAEVTSWYDLHDPMVSSSSFSAEIALASYLGQTTTRG